MNASIITLVKLDRHNISTPSRPEMILHNAHPQSSLASSNNNFANPSKLKSTNYYLPLFNDNKHPNKITAYFLISKSL